MRAKKDASRAEFCPAATPRSWCARAPRQGIDFTCPCSRSRLGVVRPIVLMCAVVGRGGRHDEGDDVLLRLEADAVACRSVFRRKGTHAHTEPGTTAGHVRFDDVSLVPARPQLISHGNICNACRLRGQRALRRTLGPPPVGRLRSRLPRPRRSDPRDFHPFRFQGQQMHRQTRGRRDQPRRRR